jgi:RNA polymerase sigma factor (sigma-70 family)
MQSDRLAEDPAGEFETLYERVAPALCVWAMRHVGRTMQERVEVGDVLQEVWLRALALKPGFAGDLVDFRRWIFGIAKKLLLEISRSVRKAQRVQIGEGRTTHLHELANVAGKMTALTQKITRDDGIRRFREYLMALPAEDQDLVSFCGLESGTVADAARKMGIGLDAANKRWQRLRQRLAEDGQGHDWLA